MSPILKYFNAEKSESLLFVLVGFIAISISLYCLFKIKQPFYNGLSYALVAIALIQLVVGLSVYFRSPKDIQRVNTFIKEAPSKIQTEEIPRMQTVNRNFIIYRWVEIALVVIGIILFLFVSKLSLAKGLGLGLSIQAGLMLLLDYFAESRALVYLNYLKDL
jgi:hypothetical protein